MNLTQSRLILGISYCLITACPAYAQSGNFLVGASGGYAARDATMLVTTLYTQPAPAFVGIPPTYVFQEYDDRGLTWGFIAGYQARCEAFILGGEFNVDWEDFEHTHAFAYSDVAAQNGGVGVGWKGNFRYQRDIALGFSLRFGYILEALTYFVPPVYIPYLRIGVETSKDTLEATYSGNPVVYPFSTTSKHQHWPIRLVVGAGIEFPIKNTGLGIRAEYNYHSTGQTLQTTSTIIDGVLLNPIFTSDINPQIQSGKISLIWNFV